jgi:two-component system OmpR family response regulator
MFKILCVDDNMDLVEVLSEMLKALNYESKTVTGGMECLDLLKEGYFRPDLILLDIMMSPMDGWATLTNLKGDPDLLMIPVFMLTGKFPTMAEVNEYSTLFDGYLMKPFALQSLSYEIENYLEREKTTEEVIRNARMKGVDEAILIEYRRLTSTMYVLKQFEEIITNGTFTKGAFIESEKRLVSIIQELDELGVTTN